MKLLIPQDAPVTLDPAPEGVEVVRYAPKEPLPPEHLDADAALAWGFPAPNVEQFAHDMPNLRWIQTLAAGPDGILSAGIPDDVAVTVGRGFHDQTVTETAVALTLAAATRLPRLLQCQADRRWCGEGYDRALYPDDHLGTIIGRQILIWGFGSIGQTMAPVFTALGAHVRGVATQAGDRGGYQCFTEDALDDLLPETDVLMMVLPSSASTAKALDARRLALLKPTSWVVNVGRGSCVDEEALVDALTAGRIGGAALDVFATEPLPEDSPLWTAPHTILTPHIAGGRPLGVEESLRRNIAHLLAGEQLEQLAKR